jgi:hypothetical protein
MEPTSSLVLQVCRNTRLPPISVLLYLISQESIALPVGFDSKNPSSWLDKIRTPKPSKTRDRLLAEIRNEGQRYQRRPQFPNSSVSKTTIRRADNLAVKRQMERVKFRLKTREEISKARRLEEKINRVKRKKEFAIRWISKARGPQEVTSRQELRVAEKRASKLLDILRSSSVMPLQGPQKIKELTTQAALTGDPIIVINWICPAGTPLEIAPDRSGLFRSYSGIDPEEGLEKDYRLIPRLNLERKLVKAFERAQIPLWYIKLVADDNPYCLYPYSLIKDGERETMEAITKYARYTQARLDREIGNEKITVWTVSEFLGQERFRELIELFKSTSINDLLPFLPLDILDIEKDVIARHTNIDPGLLPYLDSFVEAVARQYAVEGLVIRKMLGDNVIIAWNESTRRSSTIDGGVKSEGFKPFPKIFVLHEKLNGKIKNNF